MKGIEDLNAALVEAELALRDLRLGVTASVPLSENKDLTFKKQGHAWGLYLFDQIEESLTPIMKTSREIRVLAAHALANLLEALREEVRNNDKEVNDAAQAALNFTTELKNKNGT